MLTQNVIELIAGVYVMFLFLLLYQKQRHFVPFISESNEKKIRYKIYLASGSVLCVGLLNVQLIPILNIASSAH